tara:strand:- start:193 stop:399 length:207 start_codon:yes stop_codon:yes gene_type:complete
MNRYCRTCSHLRVSKELKNKFVEVLFEEEQFECPQLTNEIICIFHRLDINWKSIEKLLKNGKKGDTTG